LSRAGLAGRYRTLPDDGCDKPDPMETRAARLAGRAWRQRRGLRVGAPGRGFASYRRDADAGTARSGGDRVGAAAVRWRLRSRLTA